MTGRNFHNDLKVKLMISKQYSDAIEIFGQSFDLRLYTSNLDMGSMTIWTSCNALRGHDRHRDLQATFLQCFNYSKLSLISFRYISCQLNI